MSAAAASGRPLHVLLVHNAYQQRGGEDSVVEAEAALLRAHGHRVTEYQRHNDELAGASKAQAAVQTLWSPRTVRDFEAQVRADRPDVVHVHNSFPLVSPSIYWAADRAGIPIVQTLHNFRLFCPQAMFLREQKVCEDCLGHLPWRGVVRRCYRDSAAQTAVLTGMLGLHRALGTYRNKVGRYIALNNFCRDKFIEGGLPADRIVIKPNFIESQAQPQWEQRDGGLYVGRLSKEKGIDVLAQAAATLPPGRLRVIGGGELEPLAQQAFGAGYLGFRKLDFILEAMGRASYLVVPSVWYENFPRTIVEAYASGLPVIASRIGALAELVDHERTGLLFEPGDAADLARKLAWAEQHPQRMREMGQAARREYEQRYTPETNHEQLVGIYRSVMSGGAATEVRRAAA